MNDSVCAFFLCLSVDESKSDKQPTRRMSNIIQWQYDSSFPYAKLCAQQPKQASQRENKKKEKQNKKSQERKTI